MTIVDSIRQEAMPEMVYAICKMAQLKPKKSEMRKLITLDTEGESVAQFNKVYQFAINCGFVREQGNETVSTEFSNLELSSFRRFRYAVLQNVFKGQETNFTAAAKWYLSQNIPQNMVKGQTPFSLNTASELIAAMPKTLVVDENFINGFRFWMAALGLVSFTATGAAGNMRPPLLFATHRALSDWLEFSEPFQKEAFIPARQFFEKLKTDCPVFNSCIEGNVLSASLSTGLRVLESCGRIEMKRVTDAGDVWHLTRSNTFLKSNDITEIVIKEVQHVG